MELDEQLKLSRDRITEMLTNQRPSLGDISRSFVDAVTQRRPYGDVMNEMKAARLGEQKSLYDVLSGHKKIQQTDRQIDQTDANLVYKKYQDSLTRGDAAVKAFDEALKTMTVNPAEYPLVVAAAQDHRERITPGNASTIAAEVVNDLKARGQITQRKPVEPQKETWTAGNWISEEGERTIARKSNAGTVQVLKGETWVDAAKAGPGSFFGQNVQAATPKALGGSRADDIQADVDAINRARTKLGTIVSGIEENRSRAGLVGTAKRMGQTALGVAVDVSELLGVDTLRDFATDLAPSIIEDINMDRTDRGVAAYFDPKLAENQVFENSLAYALARARKGAGRLNKDDIENARGDVSITGLTSVDEVLTRLKAIETELSQAESDYSARLKGKPAVYRVENGRLVRVE